MTTSVFEQKTIRNISKEFCGTHAWNKTLEIIDKVVPYKTGDLNSLK
jgi:hypothetical protein